jgi:hypothetical protein
MLKTLQTIGFFMKDNHPRLCLDQPEVYQIKVQGRLPENWSAWFDNMTITVENETSCVAVTTMTGTLTDQVALHGLLSRIRDLGLPLLLVQYLEQEKLVSSQ